MIYAFIVLLVVALAVLASGLKIVPQKQVLVIERLGKYHTRAEAGMNIIVPFLDSVRARHDLREQITNIEPQSVITKDNVTMEVDCVIGGWAGRRVGGWRVREYGQIRLFPDF